MEINNNSKNTTLLMVMGFIFVAVAGVIFATTTWRYIPLIGKQIILAGVTAALFTLSNIIKRLEKTKTILYYLGTVFLGFFSGTMFLSIAEAIRVNVRNLELLNLLLANLIMLIPSVLRIYKRRTGLDFFINVLLLNTEFILWVVTFDIGGSVFTIGWATFVLLFALADYYKHKWIENNNYSLQKGFEICHKTFTGIYLFYISWILIFSLLDIEFEILVLLILVTATLLLYKKNNSKVMRVINSLLIIWSVLKGVDVIEQILLPELDLSKGILYILAYIISCAIMVWLLRKELFSINFIYAIFNTYNQLDRFEAHSYRHTTIYTPYLLILAVSIIILAMVLVKKNKITWEEQGIKMLIISGLQMTVTIMMCAAATNDSYIDMTYFLHTAVIFITIGTLIAKQRDVKKRWYTCALIAGIFSIGNQPFIKISEQFEVEWVCFCLGLGIVIFRAIWYYKGKAIETISFILTCIIMGILLVSNILFGEIANVMILGITGIIMLLISVIRNSHRYTILSAIVLGLMALYITMDFWLNIAWWIYLLIAGIVMIVFAVKKESEA